MAISRKVTLSQHQLTLNDVQNTINKSHVVALSYVPYKLPDLYIQLLRITNGCRADYEFSYYDNDFKQFCDNGIQCFYGIKCDEYLDIIYHYLNPPEFFPNHLVAFSDNGGGDMICFDYREDPKTDNPPIVFWNHEANEGEDVSFVAKDFDSFIKMLKPPTSIEEYLKKEKQ